MRTPASAAVFTEPHRSPYARHSHRHPPAPAGGHSQSSLMVHFGLGLTAAVDAAEVLWPSGPRTRWANQPANTLPGGLGEFVAKANEFLVFESAPARPLRYSGRPTTTPPTRPASSDPWLQGGRPQ